MSTPTPDYATGESTGDQPTLVTMITSAHRRDWINYSLEARNRKVIEEAAAAGISVMTGPKCLAADISPEANAQRRLEEHSLELGVPLTYFTPNGTPGRLFLTTHTTIPRM